MFLIGFMGWLSGIELIDVLPAPLNSKNSKAAVVGYRFPGQHPSIQLISLLNLACFSLIDFINTNSLRLFLRWGINGMKAKKVDGINCEINEINSFCGREASGL